MSSGCFHNKVCSVYSWVHHIVKRHFFVHSDWACRVHYEITSLNSFVNAVVVHQIGINKFNFVVILLTKEVLERLHFLLVCSVAYCSTDFELTCTFTCNKFFKHLVAKETCDTCDQDGLLFACFYHLKISLLEPQEYF